MPATDDHTSQVAKIRAARVGAEEISEDEFVCQRRRSECRPSRLNAEDVARTGRGSADRVASGTRRSTPTELPRLAPLALVPKRVADDEFVRAVDLEAGGCVSGRRYWRCRRRRLRSCYPPASSCPIASPFHSSWCPKRLPMTTFVCAANLKAGRRCCSRRHWRAGRASSDRVAARVRLKSYGVSAPPLRSCRRDSRRPIRWLRPRSGGPRRS